MALSYVRQNGLNSSVNTGNTVTFNLDCTGGDLVVVGGGDRGTASSATLNGVAMTAYTGVVNGSATAKHFSTANPPTGTQSIVITFTANNWLAGEGSLWSGFSNGSLTVTTNSGSGTTVSAAAVTATSSEYIVMYASSPSGSCTNNNGTSIYNTFNANSALVSYIVGNGGSQTLSWNAPGGNTWASTVAKITPGAATNSNFLMFM